MISHERIKEFKLCYSRGFYNNKQEALDELAEIISEVEITKIEFEQMVDEYNTEQPKDGTPYYSVNMLRWSRDQARNTYNELKTLEYKINMGFTNL